MKKTMRIKNTISLLLAAMMLVTAVPDKAVMAAPEDAPEAAVATTADVAEPEKVLAQETGPEPSYDALKTDSETSKYDTEPVGDAGETTDMSYGDVISGESSDEIVLEEEFFAAEEIISMDAGATSGTVGTNFQWNYAAETKTLTISPVDANTVGTLEPVDSSTPNSALNDIFKDHKPENIVISGKLSGSAKNLFSPSQSGANFTSINLSGLDTSKVTSMQNMFSGCQYLTSLDISNLNTSDVGNMQAMFYNCKKLSSLNFGAGFTTAKVENMSSMFWGCEGLTGTLDISKFSSEALINVNNMFKGCENLEKISFGSGFTVSKVTNFQEMFRECHSLKTLDVSMFSINTSSEVNMQQMFQEVQKVEALDLRNFDTSHVTNMNGMFTACLALTDLIIGDNFKTSSVKNMAHMFCDLRSMTSEKLNPVLLKLDTSNNQNMTGMFNGCLILTSIDLSSFKTSKVDSMDRMFEGCQNLTSVTYPDTFDTSNVFNFNAMFKDCQAITSIDLSKYTLNTAKSPYIYDLFHGCTSLTSITFGDNFNTSKSQSFDSMFNGCNSLSTLNLSGFDMSSATSASYMFGTMEKLTTLNTPKNVKINVELPRHAAGEAPTWIDEAENACLALPAESKTLTWGVANKGKTGVKNRLSWTWDGDKKILTISGENPNTALSQTVADVRDELGGTNLSSFQNIWKSLQPKKVVFSNCRLEGSAQSLFVNALSIEEFDLSGLDTAEVTDFKWLFSNCKNITEMDLSNLDTGKVTDITYLFYGCDNLENVTFGSGFNTSGVTKMERVFGMCKELSGVVDISSFDTSSVTDMQGMFEECRKITGVTFGSGFDSSNVKNFTKMFFFCEELETDSFDTSKITVGTAATTLEYMFDQCESLTTLDFSNFNTANVTNMGNFIRGCKSVTDITLGNSFTTASVTDMSAMLGHLDALPDEKLDAFIKKLDTGKVTNMSSLFNTHKTVKSLDLTGFKMSSVTTTQSIFSGCESLETLKLPAGFVTSKNTNIKSMFENCKSLKSIDVSTWDTSNCTDLHMTFYKCASLEELDISSFDLGKVAYAQDTFSYCDKLVRLKVPKNVKIDIRLPIKTGYTGATWKEDKEGENTDTYSNLPKNLTSGIWLVKVSDSGSTGGSGDDPSSPDVPDGPSDPSVKYTVTIADLPALSGAEAVNAATGAGSYVAGATVRIYAGEKANYVFSKWTATPSVQFANANSKQTTFVMPAKNVTITANWVIKSSFENPTGSTGAEVTNKPIAEKPESYTTVSEPDDITRCSVNGGASLPSKVYTGKPVAQKIKVKDGSKTLKEGTDYRLSYVNNVNVGEAFVFVTGVGAYGGSLRKGFEITGKPLNKLKAVADCVPAGSEIGNPNPIHVFDGQYELVYGQDFTYDKMTAANGSSNKITIQAIAGSNYIKGQKDLVVKVTGVTVDTAKGQALLADPAIKLVPKSGETWSGSGNDLSTVYDGKAKVPGVEVDMPGSPQKGKDYTLTYKNNKNAGTAYVTVKGKGSTYKGQVTATFEIKASAEAFSSVVINKNKDLTFNGKLQKPAVAVKVRGASGAEKALKKNKDYTVSYRCNINSGHGYVTITGMGNYDGIERTYMFNINERAIGSASKSIKNAEKITLKYAGRVLEAGEGRDYLIKVEDSAKYPGKKLITVEGIGNFKGTFTKDKVKEK